MILTLNPPGLIVLILGVDNSISYDIDHRKKKVLVFSEGPAGGINDRTGSAEKKFSINFSRAKTKFCLSLHYNGDESYLYVNKTEIYKFKRNDNISCNTFCLGSVSKDFTKDKQREISLYDFSVKTIAQLKNKAFLINILHYLRLKMISNNF